MRIKLSAAITQKLSWFSKNHLDKSYRFLWDLQLFRLKFSAKITCWRSKCGKTDFWNYGALHLFWSALYKVGPVTKNVVNFELYIFCPYTFFAATNRNRDKSNPKFFQDGGFSAADFDTPVWDYVFLTFENNISKIQPVRNFFDVPPIFMTDWLYY